MSHEIGNNPNNPYNFKINTNIVPEKVDIGVATQRNRLIEAYREGKIQARPAYQALAALYFGNSKHQSSETRYYLMDMCPDFAVEAGMSFDEAHPLWEAVGDGYRESQRGY